MKKLRWIEFNLVLLNYHSMKKQLWDCFECNEYFGSFSIDRNTQQI